MNDGPYAYYHKVLMVRGFDDGLHRRDAASLLPAGLAAEHAYMKGYRIGKKVCADLDEVASVEDAA